MNEVRKIGKIARTRVWIASNSRFHASVCVCVNTYELPSIDEVQIGKMDCYVVMPLTKKS